MRRLLVTRWRATIASFTRCVLSRAPGTGRTVGPIDQGNKRYLAAVPTFTLITDAPHAVDAEAEPDLDAEVEPDHGVPGRLWLTPADLAAATGWERTPEGLCRGDVCVPVERHPGLERDDGRIDLARLAPPAGAQLVVDAGERVAVLGASAAARAAALASGAAPDFTLPDIDGAPFALRDVRGRKTLVVAFASWCGCRHDLPAWQALHDELAGDGFGVVAVALDEDPEAVRPFADGIDMPVLIDRDRTFADSYALTNVPTVVWIDEEGRLVRANDVAFGSDMFREFHKVDSSPHHEALRRWVHDGVEPAAGDGPPAWAPSEGEQAAHLRYRLALHLWRDGRTEAALAQFDRAAADAPLDFTVRRARLALEGKDTFLGEEFLELWTEWEAAGRPYYGRTNP
jgi:peroxiredoxin